MGENHFMGQEITPLDICHYSSSYQPDYVFRWHAQSRAVVFDTLHRRHRDTRICSLISYRLLFFTCYICSVARVLLYFLYFTLILYLLLSLLLPPPALTPCQAAPVPTNTSIISPRCHSRPFTQV